MFQDPYPYRFCTIDRNKVRPHLIETHLFRFNDSQNHAYIIRAERYPQNIYAIKFFLKNHKLSERKYNLVTGIGNPSRIMGTCLAVMVELYRKNQAASFAIVGAESAGEHKDTTQRFRIYSMLFDRFFSGNQFGHITQPADSLYVLANLNQLRTNPLLYSTIIQLSIVL